MNAVSAWILSIAGAALLGVMVDLIVPDGRMHKYIRSIFGVITVLIIIAPLPGMIKNSSFDIDIDLNTANSAADNNYIYTVYKNKVAVMEKGLVNYLSDNGYQKTAVTVSVDTYTEKMRITAVYISLKNAVISDEKKHIDKYTEVTRLAVTFLNVGKEVLILSG